MSSVERPLPGVMPDRLPENATPPPDFDPKALGKSLLRGIRAGTLATLDRNTGHPFASLVNVATDADGSPLILVSRLSTHTANIEVDGRTSLLLAQTAPSPSNAHVRPAATGSSEGSSPRKSIFSPLKEISNERAPATATSDFLDFRSNRCTVPPGIAAAGKGPMTDGASIANSTPALPA